MAMDLPDLHWSDDAAGVDWAELSALYRAAPLRDKSPDWLRQAFGASRYVCLLRDAAGRLIGAVGRIR